MKDIFRRIGLAVVVLTAVFARAGAVSAQPALTVIASASSPTPNPTTTNVPVTVTLGATVENEPTSTNDNPIQGPVWTWSLTDPPSGPAVVLYRASSTGSWGAPPQNSYSLSLSQPDSSSPEATLTANFTVAGYWRISPTVTASYTDSPGTDTWSASDRPTIDDITVITVTFDPTSVSIDQPGDTATDNAYVTPSDAAGLVTFDTYDHTVATVTASSGSQYVPLTILGVGEGVTQVVAWVGTIPAAYLPVFVGADTGPVKIPLGGSGDDTDGTKFKVYVPTAAGGVLNITTTAGTVNNLMYPDGTTPYKNNTETGTGKQGWYTFEIGGAAKFKVTAKFTQGGAAATRPWNFYYWTTQGPYIREPAMGGDGKCNTTAAATDRQKIALNAAAAAGAPVVTAGADGTLETKAAGDDELRDMPGMGYPALFINAGKWKPLASYDAQNKTTSRTAAATYSDGLDAAGSNGEWCGHCLGGALASIALKVPKPAGGTVYSTEELKGLWAMLGEGGNPTFAADSLTSNPAGPPKAGVDPTDAGAPGYHLVLEKYVKGAKVACQSNMRVESATPPKRIDEKWNHAVYKYASTFVEAPGGNEKVVNISVTVTANQDHTPPTDDVKDRTADYVYIISYTAGGAVDTGGAAKKDWISVGGGATYAPNSLKSLTTPDWSNADYPQVTEKNVRAGDSANP
jgi:hypothetical protein